jgi:hypothetical protein
LSLQLIFTVLALLLTAGAALLLLVVVFRKERQLANLSLALLLMGLAVGVWWTSIRTPLAVP